MITLLTALITIVRIKIVVAGGSMWVSQWLFKLLPTKSPSREPRMPKSTPSRAPAGPQAVMPATAASPEGRKMW